VAATEAATEAAAEAACRVICEAEARNTIHLLPPSFPQVGAEEPWGWLGEQELPKEAAGGAAAEEDGSGEAVAPHEGREEMNTYTGRTHHRHPPARD